MLIIKIIDEVQVLLPHLLQFTAEHRKEGVNLQKDMGDLGEELENAVAEIWSMPQEEDGEDKALPPGDTWASRMEELEKNKRVNPVEKVPRPEVKNNGDWKMRLYDY